MLNGSLLIAASLVFSMNPLARAAEGLSSLDTVPTVAANATYLHLPTLELPTFVMQPESTPPQPASGAASDPAASGQPATGEAEATKPGISFGRSGSNSLILGFGYLNDFDDIQAGEIHVGYSHFLCDELEFNVELTGWYFDQNDDTGAINPGFNFRWHFLHGAYGDVGDPYDWTIYGEAGIGLLFAFDNVPDEGTGFNFSPRAGAGATFRLNDDGLRLQLGFRWQHFSNGRIEGDGRNPGFDGVMGYVGFVIPLN